MDLRFDYALLAWLRRGHRRKQVLLHLAKQPEPLTPTDISKTLKLHLPKVSVTLKELRNKGLVKCLTPAAPYGRLYTITTKGKTFATRIKKY